MKQIEPEEGKAEEIRDREARLQRFPHAVMLELAYPELDFAMRWCWEHFGPMDGECLQAWSEYRVCMLDGSHLHEGKWTSYWVFKTAYNYGFNEFYFADQADHALFCDHLSEFSWGERYSQE